MESTKIICDGCNEQCEHYIAINDATLRCANGMSISVSIGFRNFEIKNKHFCSLDCIRNYFYNKIPSSSRGDDFLPGEQIGKRAAGNKILEK